MFGQNKIKLFNNYLFYKKYIVILLKWIVKIKIIK
jgi:hypothetical protein